MNESWIAGGIFLLAYALIVSERIHRTITALLGGLAMIWLGVISQKEAFQAIDWNVIFLLVGMIAIANVLRETGLFQWVAIQAVRLGKGKPIHILIILTLITAAASAFLDNVTVVVLVAPVTLLVASSLGVSPIPFLITEILASNIGGTATLVGDPPNILIASAGSIDFITFALNMAPISGLILLIFLFMAWWMFKSELHDHTRQELDLEVLALSSMTVAALITDRKLLAKSLIILIGVLIGFLVHGALHLQPATIAMTGATVLMLWGRQEPGAILSEIEWTTLFFFIGLFITVQGVVEVGIIAKVSEAALRLTGGSLTLTAMLLLWFSAFASGIVDNIPYTATMIPLVRSLGESMPVMPLWWSLALGACLGGNATLVGAAANVVVANLAKTSGYPIDFKLFLRYGLITTLVSLVLASIYIWVRYL